jgi:ADP-L-glycero-D-manno-heptose 6-epimerase
MKALVTGGAGFIGSRIVKALEAQSCAVTVIDNLYSGDVKNLAGFKGELIKEDLAGFDLKRIESSHFDVIFHQAAITDTTVMDEAFMTRNNVEASQRLLEFAARNRVKFVYASSAGVYGNNPVPMKETDTCNPLNPYAKSKFQFDGIVKEYAQKDVFAVGLRYFNVYGPGEAHKKKFASMIWQLAQQMRAGKAPRIFKHGEQSRDFIYVKDVVKANMCAMNAKHSCVVNVGTGNPTTFNRIIEILNETLGTTFKPEYFDNPYGFYQNCTQAGTAYAEQCIGFKADFSCERGIKDYHKETSLQ